MAMRTYTRVLVQTWVLAGAALTAAQAADYGSAARQATTQGATPGTIVDVPAADRADTRPPQTPPRGMTKDRVVDAYGAPETRHAAVGQPPISRWDYPGYRVYFEYNHVLHAVVPSDPAPIAHADQLQKARP